MEIDENMEKLFGDAFSKDWSKPFLSDVFEHPKLRTETLDMLHPKWIASLPEFLGVLGVLRRTPSPPPDKNKLEEALTLFEQTSELSQFGDDWERYKAFWLGAGGEACVEIEKYTVVAASQGDVSKLCYEYDETLPPSALIEHPFPLREQKEGSCVAQACATMLEFLTKEPCDDFVTKLLYEEARKRDGMNAPDGGTNLRTMISWLQDGERDQRLWNAGLLCLNGRDLDTMKKTLVGASGRRPSPIVAAFTMFGTSCKSVAARRSGKWTLPISGEAPIGAHALVIFGYRDDPSATEVGGGYFIARNSWGEGYACESPIRMPGYSLIPYTYVAKYCLEAYAADIPDEKPAESRTSVDDAADEFERRYVWRLEEKTIERYEDAFGKVKEPRCLNPGIRVVGRRDDPTFVKEYTPENRKEFIERGYGWSRAGRARRFFPAAGSAGEIDATLATRAAEQLKAQASFMNGIAANVAKLADEKSTLTRGIFGTPNFRVDASPVDISKEVRSAMATANGLPTGQFDGEDVPKEYRDVLRASVSARLWRLDDGKGALVACFVAPLSFKPDRVPEFVAPTEPLMKKLAGTINTKVAETAPKAVVVAVAFGASECEPENFVNAAAPSFALVSGSVLEDYELIAGRRWRATFNATRDERLTPLRKALNPTTVDENAQIVRTIIDDPSYLGDTTLERISRKLDGALSEPELKEALDELVERSGYEYYETAYGENAIRRRTIR
ncbi:MAG: hypothetical protein IJM54_07700 [Thermoguttaceae bacterium]|nr:hypothetical protein [Thermoguttaceae bacterium]